jgi:hypothetical protein
MRFNTSETEELVSSTKRSPSEHGGNAPIIIEQPDTAVTRPDATHPSGVGSFITRHNGTGKALFETQILFDPRQPDEFEIMSLKSC